MLEVDRQYGRFTPWNEICPKKYFSSDIPIVPLWQNSYNLSCAIPLGLILFHLDLTPLSICFIKKKCEGRGNNPFCALSAQCPNETNVDLILFR